MINVQEIRRNVINVVRNYSDAQVKVRKATSNEPWGPSATLMSEIADLTYNVVAFSEIMQIIWKRLNDHGKNWRHVYKALLVLEYLIKTGSEKVAQQCRDNLFAIQTLKDFQHLEENKDQGLSIREKSKLLVNLLKDEERLKVERARALKSKERFTQSLSYLGTSPESGSSSADPTFKPSSSYPESLSASDAAARSELENARPQTAGEEKLQLELALAMSKEEAEQEERLRKNDEVRLKLALEESEKNKAIAAKSATSAVDELLSLNSSAQPSTSCMNNNNKIGSNDPWSPVATTSSSSITVAASLLPSPPFNNKSKSSQQNHLNQHRPNNNNNNSNDPWSLNGDDFDRTKPSTSSTFDDPWSSAQPPSSASVPNNDPWLLNNANDSNVVASNDPWNSSGLNDLKNQEFRALSEPVKILNQSSTAINNRRTPEGFLGPNSNLVNLDALVSSKVQTSASLNNNPFASAVPPVVNPFQANKPSQPTINELRAQTNPTNNNLMSGGDSMFSHTHQHHVSPINPVTAFSPPNASIYPQLPTNNNTSPIIQQQQQQQQQQQNSVWGTFPSQTSSSSSAFSSTATPVVVGSTISPQNPTNNPFAM